MEVTEANASLADSVDGGCADLTPETTGVREPEVIGNDDQNVGSMVRSRSSHGGIEDRGNGIDQGRDPSRIRCKSSRFGRGLKGIVRYMCVCVCLLVTPMQTTRLMVELEVLGGLWPAFLQHKYS